MDQDVLHPVLTEDGGMNTYCKHHRTYTGNILIWLCCFSIIHQIRFSIRRSVFFVNIRRKNDFDKKKKRAKIYSFLSQCRRTLRFVFESWLALLCERKSVSAGFYRDKGKFSVESIEFARTKQIFLFLSFCNLSPFFLAYKFLMRKKKSLGKLFSGKNSSCFPSAEVRWENLQ